VFLDFTKNFDSAKTLQPKVIFFLTDGPEYKRKRAMVLKKDLSFFSLRFIPFLGLHSLHGAQLVGSQKPTGFQLVHVIELSIYMAPNVC